MFRIDVNKLKGKIKECQMTMEGIAADLGMDRGTLKRRLDSSTLRLCDIHKLCEILRLTDSEAIDIFLHEV